VTFAVVQLSDCHLGASWGDGPVPALDAAISAVSELLAEPAAAVLVTGDIAHTGADEEYEQAHTLIERLNAPIFAVPGNHDDRARLRRYFRMPDTGRTDLSYAAGLGGVRLVALDTQNPGRDGGRFDSERQRWLAATLAEDSDTPTLLAMHHPPLLTGVPAMDAIGLPAEDRQAFAQIVGRHPNVQLIAAGHVHRLITATIGGAALVAIPSTTLQIALDFVDPTLRLVSEPRSVAIHLLIDGRLVTHLASVSSTW
jgi:3',5'-cyclic-AMP phosphodiesterase